MTEAAMNPEPRRSALQFAEGLRDERCENVETPGSALIENALTCPATRTSVGKSRTT
jgi:hypothetical protein